MSRLRDPPRIVTPGLSTYASPPPLSRRNTTYHHPSPTTPRTKASTPRSSNDRGLSYTSTRDLGGWLGGAALTAGAAYLLRGGNGNGNTSSKGRDSRDATTHRASRDLKYYASNSSSSTRDKERARSSYGYHRGSRDERERDRDRDAREREAPYVYAYRDGGRGRERRDRDEGRSCREKSEVRREKRYYY
jgi:hypothetical protein